MFKFDETLTMFNSQIGCGPDSIVYPYKEGSDENKWALKYLLLSDPEKVNDLLQNILISSTSNSSCIVPIKGYEIQKVSPRHSKVYIKMQRMQKSLKDEIREYQDFQQTAMPIEKIVYYFYNIVSSLDELAQKEIAHRNLKPTNVLIDKEGAVYLSDLKMIQTAQVKIAEDMETRVGDDGETLYKAPETFSANWPQNQEDIYKADVWSLGMIIAEACLMKKLVYLPPDLPLEDSKEIMEHNLAEITKEYGQYLSGILRGLLSLEPSDRENFSTIRQLLEKIFPNFVGAVPGRVEKEIVSHRDHHQEFDIRDESPKSPILSDDVSRIGRQAMLQDDNFAVWHRPSQHFKFDKTAVLQKMQRIKETFRNCKRSDVSQKLQKIKGSFKSSRRLVIFTLIALAILTTVLVSQYLIAVEKQKKFENIIEGLALKKENYFKISQEPNGVLTIEGLPNAMYFQAWGQDSFNDAKLTGIMDDLTRYLEASGLEGLVKELRFVFFSEISTVSDSGLLQFARSFQRLPGLKKLLIQKISGDHISDYGLESFIRVIGEILPNLEAFEIGLQSLPNVSNDQLSSLTWRILQGQEKLVDFRITFNNVYINDDGLRQMAQDLSESGKNLRYLSVGIEGCRDVSSFGLQQFNSRFISGLKGLVELNLSYFGSMLTDEGLEALGNSITSVGKNLLTLRLNLDGCSSISNAGVKFFGFQLHEAKLRKIQHLQIVVQYWIISAESRTWLREELKEVPDLHVYPEFEY